MLISKFLEIIAKVWLHILKFDIWYIIAKTTKELKLNISNLIIE